MFPSLRIYHPLTLPVSVLHILEWYLLFHAIQVDSVLDSISRCARIVSLSTLVFILEVIPFDLFLPISLPSLSWHHYIYICHYYPVHDVSMHTQHLVIHCVIRYPSTVRTQGGNNYVQIG